MYRIHYTNFNYFADTDFSTVEAALAYGKSRGFEFAVLASNSGVVAATWSVFGGTCRYTEAA